uniref:Uncharacterized protein n=1 Tax=Meloidogyne enterolobii TaxID=390850 RepID=A0A6V7X5M5_MELEN|nr:unnamed protein product [Meloidogyne enterolobii]
MLLLDGWPALRPCSTWWYVVALAGWPQPNVMLVVVVGMLLVVGGALGGWRCSWWLERDASGGLPLM